MQDKIFKYILAEESSYKTTPIPIVDGWDWNMYEHIRRSTLYKNSKFHKGENDGMRPFKNIIRPILNVSYRSEGFDVKDIEPFVDDKDNYYKSFLTRKYHAKWARKNDIDTFIDELVESYVDYGLALVKNVNEVKPEVVPLARLAFCDQTDILSGPLCEKHQYSTDQLMQMSGKWYPEAVEMAITMGKLEKSASLAEGKSKTPGKYTDVYELHGTFPETWLNKEDNGEEDYIAEYNDDLKFVNQIHIVSYYTGQDGEKKGICLFKGKESKPIYKALVRDKIFGRTCGFGGIEELFEPQVWVNYSEIKIKDMLDAAALMVLQTADQAFENNNKNLQDLKTGDVLYHEENKPVTQVVLQPQNIEKFNNAIIRWENQARTTGSANDPLLGNSPTSGTPFALQQLVTVEGKGIHEFRRGKIATFVSEIYRDWTLPYLVSDMNKGQKFVDELSLDELMEIADNVSVQYANDKLKEKMLPKNAKDAKVMTKEERTTLESLIKEQFMKGGRKRFIEVLKDELKTLPIDVYMNVAGKQKDLVKMADGLTNIFRQVVANPSILAMPGMGKLFNEIVEYSGFSPLDFTSFTKVDAPVVSPIQQVQEQQINNQQK